MDLKKKLYGKNDNNYYYYSMNEFKDIRNSHVILCQMYDKS